MSLKLWLPLRGDLHNQGLYNLPNPSISSLTWDDAGKLGQCVNNTAIWHLTDDIIGNVWSVALWLNNRAGTWASSNNIIFCKNGSTSSDTHIYFSILGGTSLAVGINGATSTLSYTYTFVADTWYHLAATYDGTNLSLYINGEQVKTGVSTREYTSGRNNIGLHCRSSSAAGTSRTGQVTAYYSNDLRLYDHCLSKAEVKEISKALVLHYKLDELGTSGANLIKNGNGQYDLQYWTGGVINTDIPSGQTDIKKSIKGNTTTTYFIPIESNHTYKVEQWIKNDGNTSTYIYPSIFPYDVDYNFIQNFNSRVGFSTATLTTLSQDLKPGDTVVHAVDLSDWSTAANYYNLIAVFGYADSTGYVYPDLTYTHNTIVFHSSSSTTKTEINKTDNTITLPTAYTGNRVVVGTSICQSTYGSTNFYPYGAVKIADISDWTYKSLTFTPADDGRLLAARYIKYNTYGNSVLHAGIKLTDLTYGNVVMDSSGYNNNGENIDIETSLDSVRYDSNVSFNGTSSAIKVLENDWASQGMEEMTINLWIKRTTSSFSKLFSCTESGGWNTEGGNSGYVRFPVHVYTDEAKTSTAYKYDSTELKIADVPQNEWTMVTFVYDNTGVRTYINGQLHHTYSYVSYGIHYNMNARLFLGCEANGANPSSPYFTGQMSDFRIYAAALDEEAILDLYHTPASIDKNGNVYAREVVEI